MSKSVARVCAMFPAAVLLAGLLVSACAEHERAPTAARQSGVIQSQVGFVDVVSGARVDAVETVPGMNEYRVLVSLPARDNEPPTEIEEVLVTAPRIDNEPPLFEPRYEFVKDYAADRYGFYIYLGKQKNIPFRLYFKDHSAGSIQNTQP
ncbi:hypothetical protein [Spongiibacter sp.]|uniref:hypothetical protein n=1 Tax=Spongiibacter sp. TaxID=2024860 RepID=UPI0035695641